MDNIKKNNDSFTVTGNWQQQSRILKETFPNLTDSDLKFEIGRERNLLSRIQNRLGKKRDEVIELLRGGHIPLAI